MQQSDGGITMNEMSRPATLATQFASIGNDELRALRAAQERARGLRDEAIARLREQIKAFATELSLSSSELQSLLPLKRRKKSATSETSPSETGESEGN